MVAVEARNNAILPLTGFPATARFTVPRFFIDRTEVANREFQEFVDANGYQRPEFWTHKFVKADRVLPFQEAMSEFRDATDRPGPAGFELGKYRKGEGDYPVGGVSWYEAAAYCEFRGKRLPTIFDWASAALPANEISNPLSPSIIPLSNFAGEGPAPVGTYPAISASGAYDMAGNVREWCLNAAGERRFALGGGWSDPVYAFPGSVSWAQPPWDRLPSNGFRCVKYPEGGPDEALMAPVDLPIQDFYGVPKRSDDVFEALRKAYYSYDPAPLNAVVESEGRSPYGGDEVWVSVDAAYGPERLLIRLHLPDEVEPPYQAVVWFQGIEVLSPLRSIKDSGWDRNGYLDFILGAGRALVQPIYAGTFERNDGRTMQRWQSPRSRRDLVVLWLKDLGRTLDYLKERGDIDCDRVAYAGMSLGAALAPQFMARENRFAAALLWSGGFGPSMKEGALIDSVDFTRRTTIPILMLSGRYDYVLPFETHQMPFFDLLGTPPEDKRLVVFDAGHWPFPRAEFIKENLAWLDKYLGPVERAAQ
jgi:pimeloyl-ACP methyl ester carboxylesterase